MNSIVTYIHFFFINTSLLFSYNVNYKSTTLFVRLIDNVSFNNFLTNFHCICNLVEILDTPYCLHSYAQTCTYNPSKAVWHKRRKKKKRTCFQFPSVDKADSVGVGPDKPRYGKAETEYTKSTNASNVSIINNNRRG